MDGVMGRPIVRRLLVALGVVFGVTAAEESRGAGVDPKATAKVAQNVKATLGGVRSRFRAKSFKSKFATAFKLEKAGNGFAGLFGTMSLADARAYLKKPAADLVKTPVAFLARAGFVLWQEGVQGEYDGLIKLLSGKDILAGLGNEIVMEVQAAVKEFVELFSVPCQKSPQRQGTSWPPIYTCSDLVKPVTAEPVSFFSLKAPPGAARPPTKPSEDKPAAAPRDPNVANGRYNAFVSYEGKVVDNDKRFLADGKTEDQTRKLESLRGYGVTPSKFCFGGGPTCQSDYKSVVAGLYPGAKSTEGLPVFCVPQKLIANPTREMAESDVWDHSKVYCSTNWVDTLGGWQPWIAQGSEIVANTTPPAPFTIPPFACFANSKFVEDTVLPTAAGPGGFYCRRRIFRVLAQTAAKSTADLNQQLVQQCLDLREQTWGEKYTNINDEYCKWCKGQSQVKTPAPPADKSLCPTSCDNLPPKKEGEPGLEMPYMLLSREELLYFFGHRELFCRADRKGLTHFLYNSEWAESFTCNVSRGIIEAGPFEEGVQVCAVTPYSGDPLHTQKWQGRGLSPRMLAQAKPAYTDNVLKLKVSPARLHCWQFNRPTCEDVSKQKSDAEKIWSIHRSSVFDVFDTFREYRRTQQIDVWALLDPKDIEKRADWQETIAFADAMKDEDDFGVKDFCRIVEGDLVAKTAMKLQCGYTKKTIAQWYELHRNEEPAQCEKGACVRGAWKRGYLCAVRKSKEYFASDEYPGGKPFWLCGIDIGIAGRNFTKDSNYICVGGERGRGFQSPRGDGGTLQCYARRFQWAESQESEVILKTLTQNWASIVSGAAAAIGSQTKNEFVPNFFDEWLYGGEQYRAWYSKDNCKKDGDCLIIPYPGDPVETKAQAVLSGKWILDVGALKTWATTVGSSLGHRTSMWKLLIKSNIPAVQELLNMNFKDRPAMYNPLGSPDKSFELGALKEPNGPDREPELTALIADLKAGSPADDKWYQDFRAIATDGSILRIKPEQLAAALRVFHLYEALEEVRVMVLAQAKEYARKVKEKAVSAPLLSRIELLEAARNEAIAPDLRGNVFCVAPIVGSGKHTRPAKNDPFYCASSPLLAAGIVELWLEDKAAKRKKPYTAQQEDEQRGRFKSNWCYGGLRASKLFGLGIGREVLDAQKPLNSPFGMDVPQSVVVKTASGSTYGASWLRCSGFSYGDSPWQLAGAPKKPAPSPQVASDPPEEQMSKQYTPPAIPWPPMPTHDADGDEIDPEDIEDAKEDSGDMANEAGGLLKVVIDLVLPELGDAQKLVTSASSMASDFMDEWKKKLVALVMNEWVSKKGIFDKLKADVAAIKDTELPAALKLFYDETKKQYEKLNELNTAFATAQQQYDKEKAQPGGKVSAGTIDALAKAKQAYEDKMKNIAADLAAFRKDKVAPVEKKLQDAVNAVMKFAQSKDVKDLGTVPGTLLGNILEKMSMIVTGRASDLIKPKASELFAKGWAQVRKVLDPLLGAAIGAIGSIPFVGGALAFLAQVVYTVLMDQLQSTIFEALWEIVERGLAKMVSVAITPAFNAIKKQFLSLVHSACAEVAPDICPRSVDQMKFGELPAKDRWIDRALACKHPPVIDDNILRRAAIARGRLEQIGNTMQRKVASYVRGFANRALAKYGHTYDSWLAAAGHPTPEFLAKAAEVERGVRLAATKIRGASQRPIR